jgi:hypothetical protein
LIVHSVPLKSKGAGHPNAVHPRDGDIGDWNWKNLGLMALDPGHVHPKDGIVKFFLTSANRRRSRRGV